ncbi:MAG: GNAT family N-acetyltransferase [Xanthomonadales bacterium]|nr:GNAT family N-acetyltransferase [Xanthomonadales bacterium]
MSTVVDENSNSVFCDDRWIARGSSRVLSLVGPPLAAELDRDRLDAYLKSRNAYFAIWNIADPDAGNQWYRCICDTPGYSIDKVESKNSRQNLRKALKRTEVRPIEIDWLIPNAYPVYIAASQRFKHHRILDRPDFERDLARSLEGSGRRAVAAFIDERLVAFMTLIECGETLFGDRAYFDPGHSSANPMWALYYSVAHDAIASGFREFDRGTRPLVHETAVDQFLARLGFRLDPCRLGFHGRQPFMTALRTGSPLIPGLAALIRLPFLRSVMGLDHAFRLSRL